MRDSPSPIDGRFLFALVGLEEPFKKLPTPFSKALEQAWKEIARSQRKGIDSYPGSLQRLQQFKQTNGIDTLRELAKRGANPNFILSLLVKYAWCEDVPERKHERSVIQMFQDYRRAIKGVRELVVDLDRHNGRLEKLLALGIPSADVGQWLAHAEQRLSSYLDGQEYERSPKRHMQSDKANRAIFAIHQYLKQTTGGPNWSLFKDLLLAAQLIREGIRNDREVRFRSRVNDDPAAKIMNHIKTFKKSYPRECVAIQDLMQNHFSEFKEKGFLALKPNPQKDN